MCTAAGLPAMTNNPVAHVPRKADHGTQRLTAYSSPPPSPPPPRPPPLPPSYAPLGNALGEQNTLSLQSGPCEIRDSGRCVASPNFPSDYGNSQECSISVILRAVLTVRAFNIENNYDFFTVNHALSERPTLRRTGTWHDGLDGLIVEAGSELHFQSDQVNTRGGFLVCAGAW
eukprot:360487-Prorocentrum_minimum.AAC.1